MKRVFTYKISGEEKTVTVTEDVEGLWAEVEGRTYHLTSPEYHHDNLSYMADDHLVRAAVIKQDDRWFIHSAGRAWTLEEPAAIRGRRGEVDGQGGEESGVLTATMPGQIVDVLVEAGDEVTQGQTLVLMEAMKMELHITAPFGGVVRQMHCAVGGTVNRDDVLVEIDKIANDQ